MLDDGDIALDDLLIHIICGRVVLNGVKLWLCTYMVYGFIKQISFGRADFTDRPVIITDIILGRKLPVFISSVGVNQFLALVNAVDRSCKGGVALRRASCFHISLCDCHVKLLQYVVEAAVCDLFPFNRGCLGCRDDIADSRIHFLKHIRGVAADKDILKLRQTIFIRHGIFVHGQTAEGSPVKVEFHALHQIVLGSLDNLQTATL